MAPFNKMTVAQLIDVRDATQEKLDSLVARKPGKNEEVNEAFDRVKSDLKRQIVVIDAEIASRK